MQNVAVVSKPEFHALSNGAFATGDSLILCTGKWISTRVVWFKPWFKY
jgi:hypothetical protein